MITPAAAARTVSGDSLRRQSRATASGSGVGKGVPEHQLVGLRQPAVVVGFGALARPASMPTCSTSAACCSISVAGAAKKSKKAHASSSNP
jgi:hypothetical protein